MQLANLKWPDVAALSRTTPVVLPVAALEQHGHHMPLFTDSLLLGEVVRRASAELEREALFAPLLWLGNSEHHLDFPGTMTASPRVYLDLLRDMVETFLVHGFRRIVILNGHGGNIVPAQQALFEVRQRHRDESDLLLLSATYWSLGESPSAADRSLAQKQMGHACEWETSMMLSLAPQLVGNYQSAAPVSQDEPFQPAYLAWITNDRTVAGHIGQPAQASAEKGERLLARFTGDVVTYLRRVAATAG